MFIVRFRLFRISVILVYCCSCVVFRCFGCIFDNVILVWVFSMLLLCFVGVMVINVMNGKCVFSYCS